MVNLAIKDVPYFSSSPLEIERGGISYTVDTLRELRKSYPMLELIIGMDNLEKFYTWKEPDEILKLASLVVMERESKPRELPIDRFYEAAEFVRTPVIDIKATEIRQRVRKNLPIDFLVPKEIKEYIFRYNLYK